MGQPIRAYHVVCRDCYGEHRQVVAKLKGSPPDAEAIRKKLRGQRYATNRTPSHRVHIAYAAYLLASQGDEELLQEVRTVLLARPVVDVASDIQGAPSTNGCGSSGEGLDAEAREVAFLESKLSEGRAKFAHGPGSYRTVDGHYVRSKSERDIANFLFYHRIPYQYERPTKIGGVSLHPDFFLPDVGSGGLFLEHFGMVENSDYRALAARKAQLFERAGRTWIATDERDAHDIDAAIRLKLGPYVDGLV